MNQKISTKLGIIIIAIMAVTIGMFVWKYSDNKLLNEKSKIDNKNTVDNHKSSVLQKEVPNKKKTLQIYKNDTYGYWFKYSPDLVLRTNSSDENVILAKYPDGNWQYSVSVSSNPDRLSLSQIFDQAVKSLKTNKEDLIISDMLIGHQHAKKYSIKNYQDYGNMGIIFLDKDKIFTIHGDDSTQNGEINLDFISQNFAFIPSPTKEDMEKNHPYFIDDTGIYYVEQFNILNKLEDVDENTFKLVGSCSQGEMYFSHYGKDNDHVYVNGDIVKNISASSFEYLGFFNNYDGMPWGIAIAKDKNNIYYGCGKVANLIKKESFEILNYGYAKDSKSIYYLNSVLRVADCKSFNVLGVYEINNIKGPFAIDEKNTYFEGRIIKEISPQDCENKGLEACLPENWYDSLEDSEKSLSPITLK